MGKKLSKKSFAFFRLHICIESQSRKRTTSLNKEGNAGSEGVTKQLTVRCKQLKVCNHLLWKTEKGGDERGWRSLDRHEQINLNRQRLKTTKVKRDEAKDLGQK